MFLFPISLASCSSWFMVENNPQKYGLKFIDQDLTKHAHLLYRFGDEEEIGLPFEYETYTPWGKSLSRTQITQNIKIMQNWLRERGMSY